MNISDRFGTSSGYIALMCLVNSISGRQTFFPERVQELLKLLPTCHSCCLHLCRLCRVGGGQIFLG